METTTPAKKTTMNVASTLYLAKLVKDLGRHVDSLASLAPSHGIGQDEIDGLRRFAEVLRLRADKIEAARNDELCEMEDAERLANHEQCKLPQAWRW